MNTRQDYIRDAAPGIRVPTLLSEQQLKAQCDLSYRHSEVAAGRDTTVNGWSPPLVHDRETQRPRIATQHDIDAMELRLAELERFLGQSRRLLEQTRDRLP